MRTTLQKYVAQGKEAELWALVSAALAIAHVDQELAALIRNWLTNSTKYLAHGRTQDRVLNVQLLATIGDLPDEARTPDEVTPSVVGINGITYAVKVGFTSDVTPRLPGQPTLTFLTVRYIFRYDKLSAEVEPEGMWAPSDVQRLLGALGLDQSALAIELPHAGTDTVHLSSRTVSTGVDVTLEGHLI